MKRNQHRALRSVINARSPDVEHQAFLPHSAGLLVPLDHHPVLRAQVGNRLRTTLAVAEALANPGPGSGWFWRHKAVLAPGGRAVGNTFEFLDTRCGDSLNLPRGGFHHVKNLAADRAILRGNGAWGRGRSLRDSFLRERATGANCCDCE